MLKELSILLNGLLVLQGYPVAPAGIVATPPATSRRRRALARGTRPAAAGQRPARS